MSKLITILLIFVFIFSSAYVFAVGTPGETNKYECRVKKCEFGYNSANYQTVYEDATGYLMDIASVDFDQLVAEFLQNGTIPLGTYNTVRLTVDDTFVINGTVVLNGTTYYTPGGTAPIAAPTSGPASDYAVTNVDGDTIQVVTGTEFTVANTGQTITVNVNMNANGFNLVEDGGNYYVSPTEPAWVWTAAVE